MQCAQCLTTAHCAVHGCARTNSVVQLRPGVVSLRETVELPPAVMIVGGVDIEPKTASTDVSIGASAGPQLVQCQFVSEAKLITMIEGLLEQAKSGKLRSMAYASVQHDDLIQSGATHTGYWCADGTSFALDAAISRLRHRWDKDRDEELT